MEKRMHFQPSAYEQTVIGIIRKLPPEHIVQLINFARFLEFQTTKEYKDWLEEEEIETAEEKWDELLTKPEAKRVMREMAREAREDYRAGRTTDIEISWESQFKAMAEQGDDKLLNGDVLTLSTWDEDEWKW